LAATTGCFLCLYSRSKHHRFQGDDGILAPKTRQHVLRHLLRQDATLGLQLIADNILQPQHLGSGGLQHLEHIAHFSCRLPGTDRVETEGHQCCFSLAQEVLDLLGFDHPRSPKLFHCLVRGGQFLEPSIRQPLLPGGKLFLLGGQFNGAMLQGASLRDKGDLLVKRSSPVFLKRSCSASTVASRVLRSFAWAWSSLFSCPRLWEL
jgi:hypothetical protein